MDFGWCGFFCMVGLLCEVDGCVGGSFGVFYDIIEWCCDEECQCYWIKVFESICDGVVICDVVMCILSIN